MQLKCLTLIVVCFDWHVSKHSDNPYWPGECRNDLYVESFENHSIVIIFFTTNPLVLRTSVLFYDLKKITSCLLRSIFLGHVMNQFHANLLYTHCIEMVNRRSFCKDTNIMCWGPSVHATKWSRLDTWAKAVPPSFTRLLGNWPQFVKGCCNIVIAKCSTTYSSILGIQHYVCVAVGNSFPDPMQSMHPVW